MTKQIEKYKKLVDSKLKEKSEVRKMVEVYRSESEAHKKEKQETLQLLTDAQVDKNHHHINSFYYHLTVY